MGNQQHIVFVESNLSGLNAFRTAKAEGFEVSFVRSLDNVFLYDGQRSREMLGLVDRIIELDDSFCEAELKRNIAALHGAIPVDAVVTVLEYGVVPVAGCCEHLGLPGSSKAALMVARDKYRCNCQLAAAGIPTKRCKAVWQEAEAVAAAAEIGYPVVIKPNHGCASLFVRVANNPNEVIDAVRDYQINLPKVTKNIQSAISGSLIVEEYLSGRMFSAEVGISCGEFVVFTIGERKRSQVVEAIELGTTMPAPIAASIWDVIASYAESVTRALNLEQGLFHIELILTKEGPRLMDFNPRLMGGILPRLYNYAYGDDIFGYLLDAHLKRPLRPHPGRPTRFATSRAFGSRQKRQTNQTFDLSWMEEYKDYDLKLDLRIRPGQVADQLRSNHSYLGFLRVRGDTAVQSAERADQILELVGRSLGLQMVT